VVNPGARQQGIAQWWQVLSGFYFNLFGPRLALAGAPPFQDIQPSPVDVVLRIEKAKTVTVVRYGIKRSDGHGFRLSKVCTWIRVCQRGAGLLSADMRITGGQARGIPLVTPKGDAVRPATDGMRQAVFSSIAHRVPGARFLDLFAGSGAYGLEALSRGASGGAWVEKNNKAAECVRRNLVAVGKSLGRELSDTAISIADATHVPWPLSGLPDMVFVDPPYEIIEEVAPGIFAKLSDLLKSHPDPLVIFEMPGKITLCPAGWTCVKRLGKGAHQPSVGFFLRVTT
jgi:16S rRNA (guanine966-N2)-methyltransferase